MESLRSYLLGEWQAGTGAPTTLFNPTTEEPIAEVRRADVDWARVLEHARESGGSALRAMSFRARAALLKDLSAALHEQREQLIELSIRNAGSTRGDAKFDVDGATATLAAYASFGEALGDGHFLGDGAGVQLGRTARFWGQHILVPRLGCAVHVNAFNFPAWNMMEKAACALLAGCPVIEKAGTPTAMVAQLVAQIIVDSGLLPEGAYQFVAGSVGDLLDQMQSQDCLAFTGSSHTAAILRGNANLVRRNVRVNIEADSLNAALLAPDVASDSDTYGLFLSNVALDITQKAGQKCTAVRRVFVPAERMDEVREDLVAALGRVAQGDPSVQGTRMGPLASKAQLEDVRAGIERLCAAGDLACGGTDAVQPQGYFVAPTLCVARDAADPVFHAEEVFGPVASLLPTSGGAAEMAHLVGQGGGGLVSSLYSNDKSWTQEACLALAPWNGRIWIGSDKMAEQAIPPGTVLPAMVHGGPGRAGGGEELGGLRGLEFYLQRTALQGFKGLVSAFE